MTILQQWPGTTSARLYSDKKMRRSNTLSQLQKAIISGNNFTDFSNSFPPDNFNSKYIGRPKVMTSTELLLLTNKEQRESF